MSAEHDDSQPDLYGMLGVDREASREEIARAWRRRARAEHPDFRPGDAAAAARFSALAEAYRVLCDPAGRAAYDRAAGYYPRPRTSEPGGAPGRPPTVRRQDLGSHDAVIPVVRLPGTPLRAGPVQVEPWPQPPEDGLAADEGAVPEQVLRYLSRWGRAW